MRFYQVFQVWFGIIRQSLLLLNNPQRHTEKNSKRNECLLNIFTELYLCTTYYVTTHMNEECLPPTVLPSPSLLSRSDCDVRRSLAPSKRCCNSSAVISPELIYILITLLDKTLLLPQNSHAK